MDPHRTIATPRAASRTFAQGTAGPGEIGYPPAGARFMNVEGQPVWEKLVRYAPIEDSGRCVGTTASSGRVSHVRAHSACGTRARQVGSGPSRGLREGPATARRLLQPPDGVT
jgi:hypothetical protein